MPIINYSDDEIDTFVEAMVDAVAAAEVNGDEEKVEKYQELLGKGLAVQERLEDE